MLPKINREILPAGDLEEDFAALENDVMKVAARYTKINLT